MIQLTNVSKEFRSGNGTVKALDTVTLDIAQGEIMGVIGTSGAGKSTLIRCVNLLETPTAGTIIVNGQDLLSLSHAELIKARRKISMIFQHFNLLSSRTVFDNIALPLELEGASKQKIKDKVNELLELVGLVDKKSFYPANLSGGQKQRVAIARALACDPKVLLCDEATSALDPATTRSILDLIKNINRRLNLTVLLITHEMEVVKSICDRVAVISQGRLIEQNSVGELFSHPQTQLAKEFIKSTLHIDIPEDYAKRLQPHANGKTHPLLNLEFTGESVDAPLISQMARKFDVDISILSSQIDYAGGTKFGIMLAELFGISENTTAAIDFLRQHHVKVEVLGYV